MVSMWRSDLGGGFAQFGVAIASNARVGLERSQQRWPMVKVAGRALCNAATDFFGSDGGDFKYWL